MESSKKAAVIENLVNDTTFRPARVAFRLSKMHRYLQMQFFNLCYHYLIILAHKHNLGEVDARNADAASKAFSMINAISSSEELYNLYSGLYVED